MGKSDVFFVVVIVPQLICFKKNRRCEKTYCESFAANAHGRPVFFFKSSLSLHDEIGPKPFNQLSHC